MAKVNFKTLSAPLTAWTNALLIDGAWLKNSDGRNISILVDLPQTIENSLTVSMEHTSKFIAL
jgi:hypothetical protein